MYIVAQNAAKNSVAMQNLILGRFYLTLCCDKISGVYVADEYR